MTRLSQIVNVTEEESDFEVVTLDNKLGRKLEAIPPGCKYAEGKPYWYKVWFRAGVYATPKDLLDELDQALQKRLGDLFTKQTYRFQSEVFPYS